jgi:hypothetical protein
MAKQVLLFADTATGVLGRFLPESMFNDLLALVRAPVEQIRQVADRLTRESGFVTPDRLDALIRAVVPDELLATAIRNALEAMRSDYIPGTIADLRAIRETNPRYAASLTPDILSAIEVRLTELLPNSSREYPGLERYHKAARLVGATGATLDGVDLICDLRPVFDRSREVVEGFLPQIVLRLNYRGLTDARQAVEVRMTERQLDELIGEAQKAQRKLQTLRELADGRLPGEWLTIE